MHLVLLQQYFELVVADNVPLVTLILQLVTLNVFPDLFGHLWSRKLYIVNKDILRRISRLT